MDFARIREDIKTYDNLDLDIISCVNAASYKLSDREYNLVCSYVYKIWYNIEKTYTQLIADIVCDLYQDLGYNYRDEENFLTLEDLEEGNKQEMVIKKFYDKYYD